MLREARIILPLADNDGVPLDPVHEWLTKSLCSVFGGCTVTPSHGAWVAPTGKLYSEPGKVYDVACDDNPNTSVKLTGIAETLAHLAHQECVYLRLPSGDVEFVAEQPVAVAA